MPFLQKKWLHLTFFSHRNAIYKVTPRIGGHHFLLCQQTNKKDIAGQSARVNIGQSPSERWNGNMEQSEWQSFAKTNRAIQDSMALIMGQHQTCVALLLQIWSQSIVHHGLKRSVNRKMSTSPLILWGNVTFTF